MSGYTRRFLQELVDDIRVDLADSEIQDIRDAVNELLLRCKHTVEDKHPYFKSSEIVPCGSMAEGTRIWKFTDDDMSVILEFDCLAKLQNFKPETFEARHACGGFMHVQDKCGCLPDKYTNNEEEHGTVGNINAIQVSFSFRLSLMRSVSGLCDCHFLDCTTRIVKGFEVVTLKSVKRTQQYRDDCDKCKIRKPTGTLVLATDYKNHPVEQNCSIVFLWKRNPEKHIHLPCELTRQKPKINSDFIILIDFLPTIELYYTESTKEDIQTPECVDTAGEEGTADLSRRWFLVPKVCKNDHNTCWKVSHCLFEINLMKSTDSIHRQCYMIVKFIYDYLSSDMGPVRGAPTTYVLKTSVLYHIKTCTKGTPDLTDCTMDILQYLSEAHKKCYLPHLVLKAQNFLKPPSVDREFRFMKEHEEWSRNRNELLGKFWAFILKVFHRLDEIIGPVYEFGNIQTVLKLSTTKYGRAYMLTTFKVRHEPDEEIFFIVLKKIARDFTLVSPEEFQDVTQVIGDVNDVWEKSLPDELVTDAYKLYAQMQHKVPDAINSERIQAIKQMETLYLRKQ